MEKKVIVLDIDYVTINEKPVVRLFAKKGDKNFILIDNRFRPYLYALSEDNDKCIERIKEKIDVEAEKVIKKDFKVEREFIKVTFKHPQELAKNRDVIRETEGIYQIREYDIPFYRRYLMDKDLIPMTEVIAVGDEVETYGDLDSTKNDYTLIKLTEDLKRVNDTPHDFRILSFDLEVRNPHGMPNAKEDEIIMIGVSTNFGIKTVLSTKTNSRNDDFIQKFETEKEMVEEFVRIVKESNIDIIVGYNSDNFDLPYLKDRARILDVKLSMGMDGSDLKFMRRGYANSGYFKGMVHVDLYLVMRRYMSLDRYTLERVYEELFGEKKIDVPGHRIWEFWDNGGDELDTLFDYSLDDVVATLKIAEQTLPLSLELTRIIGQPLFDIARMATGQQAEWFLVKQAYFDDEVIPNKSGANFADRASAESNEGGYVLEPDKGLHENLVQFDFRSLYPSIIISKNISPDVMTLDDVENEDDYYIAPEHGIKFKKSPRGFIPSVIDKILQERFRIKRQMKATEDKVERKSLDVQQQAIKRLANTMYGIYGFPRFRWYSFDCAKAITSWGRMYIKSSIKKAEEFGFYTIYADTDGFYAKYRRK